ncbi:hypothetical protein JOD97_000630 [Duganella sp. 1411]|jgi:hypothetical protein|uniref:porin n=1 Tax=Duganella sp. 1411 TaxID=2806572 RepID=UPI001B60F5F7|nr:porin [Duganella sp. 1411]MBP1202616.1 hypothetical protein [Duganella sp. 1411]
MKQTKLAIRASAHTDSTSRAGIKSLMALAVLGAFAATASAQDGLPITISGFGTAAVTRTNTDQAEFSRVSQAAGVGKDFRTGVDSDFGVQATLKYSDNLSFTAQGLVLKRGEHDAYTGNLAWAFAKYKISDDFSARLGRIAAPIYMISDVRNVGYANTMLRPPTEVYAQVPMDSIDGGDILYQHSFGDSTLSAQLAAGTTKNKSPGTTANIGTVAAQVTLENGPFTYRLARSQANVSIHNGQLDQLVGAVKAAGLGVSDQLDLIDFKGTFTAAGLIMDYKNILAQTEYAVRKTDTRLVPDTTSWYVMLGYRVGKFVPYYLHGDVKQDSIRSFSSLPTSGPLAGLSAGLNGAIKTGEQSSNAIGVRWDFYKSAALKVQIDRLSPRNGAGTLINVKPGYDGKDVTVYAAAIDFVF